MLQYLILGGLLGMLGQGARAAIGLKSMSDDAKALGLSPNDLFESARLITSIIIGFLVGIAAALAYAIGHGGIPDLLNDFATSYHVLIGFIAAGYAGTDFLEGFIAQYLPAGTAGPAAEKVKAQLTTQVTAQVTAQLANALTADPKLIAVITCVNRVLDATHSGWNSDGNGDNRTMSYFGYGSNDMSAFLGLVKSFLAPKYTLAVDKLSIDDCCSATVSSLKTLIYNNTN